MATSTITEAVPNRFPYAPLLELIELRARADGNTPTQWVAKNFGGASASFYRQYCRMLGNPDGTMHWATADRYAGLLNIPVSNIWPEWYGEFNFEEAS